MRYIGASAILILVGIISLGTARPVWAIVVAAPTGPVKAAQSELIVVGKVMSVGQKIEASPTPLVKNKVPYSIAVIAVADTIKGDLKDKTISVGFLTAAPAGVKSGAVPVIKLAPGDEGLFYLKKHHEGNFHVLPVAGTFVASKNKVLLGQELEEARQTVKAMVNPLAILKAADAGKRLETVALLIPVYQTAPLDANYKVELIDAEQSKLILKTLLEVDWDYKKYTGANFRQNPAKLFDTLGLGPKEGFQKPIQGLFSAEYATAAKNWLTKNWETYRLHKVVVIAAAAATEK